MSLDSPCSPFSIFHSCMSLIDWIFLIGSHVKQPQVVPFSLVEAPESWPCRISQEFLTCAFRRKYWKATFYPHSFCGAQGFALKKLNLGFWKYRCSFSRPREKSFWEFSFLEGLSLAILFIPWREELLWINLLKPSQPVLKKYPGC